MGTSPAECVASGTAVAVLQSAAGDLESPGQNLAGGTPLGCQRQRSGPQLADGLAAGPYWIDPGTVSEATSDWPTCLTGRTGNIGMMTSQSCSPSSPCPCPPTTVRGQFLGLYHLEDDCWREGAPHGSPRRTGEEGDHQAVKRASVTLNGGTGWGHCVGLGFCRGMISGERSRFPRNGHGKVTPRAQV